MLPFLKKDSDASVSAPVDPVKRKPDDDSEYDGLHTCMEELGAALKKDDHAGAASAFKAAFELCESQPHKEGEHT